MLVTSPPALAAALLCFAVSCTPSSTASPVSTPSPPRVTAPSVTPTVVPSFPADATVVRGATTEIRMNRAGRLFVAVEAIRTPSGVRVTARYTRGGACYVEKADPQTQLVVCPTKYEKRVTLPPSAFTYDSTLDKASFTATLEKKRLTITWTGFGAVRRQANENGALLVEMRDALGVATWGTKRYRDKAGGEAESSLYHRVTAKR